MIKIQKIYGKGEKLSRMEILRDIMWQIPQELFDEKPVNDSTGMFFGATQTTLKQDVQIEFSLNTGEEIKPEKKPEDMFSPAFKDWVKTTDLKPLTNSQHRFAEFLLDPENADIVSQIGGMEAIFIEVRKWLKETGKIQSK